MKRLIDQIKLGAPVLTVNIRLSRYIQNEYDRSMREEGATVWQTPIILPFSAWFERLWENSWPDKPIISKVRSSILWDEIISGDSILLERGLISTSGLVKSSFEAYRLMKEYRLPFLADEFYLTEEIAALKRWHYAYEKRLAKLGFIDQAGVCGKVQELIKTKAIELPEEIIIAGFDEITPQMAAIIGCLKENGCKISFWPFMPAGQDEQYRLPELKGDVLIRAFESEIDEVVHVARWVREVYRPGMKIAIVAPQLGRYMEIIRREFSAELDPASVLPGAVKRNIFNISLGGKLSDGPLISSALDILSIDARKLDIEKVSAILLSPYLSPSKEERIQLAKVDADLKKDNRYEISLFELRKILSGRSYGLPNFRRTLDRWIEYLKESGASKLPSLWAEAFSKLLGNLKWPSASITLSSGEYQALISWNELLATFAGLDDITGNIERREALSYLKKIAGEKLFQPETPDCPIEIMGLLETSGMKFDYIWLLGADEYALPREPSPNPFIALDVQRKNGLPGSSYERELSYSIAIVKRLFDSADHFHVSYPLMIDNREAGVSPLFRKITDNSIHIRENDSRLGSAVHRSGRLEKMPEEGAIPTDAEELEYMGGGTSILKNQSACPFRAFAVHRLNSVSIDETEPGMTASERGTAIHSALKHFWERVKGSEGLKEAMEDGSLNEVIADAVEKGLEEVSAKRSIGQKFAALERQRLAALVSEWIEIESIRKGFEIDEVESEREIVIDKLKMNARIDRVDRVDNGQKVIIDYKTGQIKMKDWLGDRPSEPQLLLYSKIESFDAISFAALKKNECKFIGLAKEEDLLPGIKAFGSDNFSKKIEGVEDWDELMLSWNATVEGLASDFINGELTVAPKNYGRQDSACRYCDQKLLCRIFEMAGPTAPKE